MVQVEITDIIHAPKEKVYAINVAFQDWPKIYPWVESVRLISERGNERTLESVVTDRKGKRRVVQTIQRVVSSDRIEVIQRPVPRMAPTIMISYSFEATPEGTRLLINASLGGSRVKYNFLFQAVAFLFRKRIMNGLRKALQRSLELEKKAAEAE